MHDAEFLAAIAAAPEEAAPYLVYADALLHRGDPRGELIIVQHALETAGAREGREWISLRRREAELLDIYLEEWLGPAAEHRDSLIVRWRRGFLAGARVRLRGSAPAVAPLRALLDAPGAAATLAELRLGPNMDARAGCRPMLDALCERPPAGLRRLYLGDGPLDGMWAQPWLEIALDRLAQAAPRLELLAAQASVLTLRGVAAPALRSLALHAPELSPGALAQLERWPALASLRLCCAAPGPLAPWLDPARFPALRALELIGAADGDAVAAELRRLPIAGQLTSIAVTAGTATEWGARALADLAHAPRLDLRGNAIDAATVRALREQDPARVERGELLLEPQRRAAGPWSQRAALVELARAAPEPWARVDPERWARAGGGEGPDRAAAAAIEQRWSTAFAPELRTHGRELCSRLADHALRQLALDEAEAWQWRAYQHERWYGWVLFSSPLREIATLCLRQGDIDAAIPLFERLAAEPERRSGGPPGGPSSANLLALAFAELARGRLARAELQCRRAREVAAGPARGRGAAGKSAGGAASGAGHSAADAREALAAILWARHDVESAARGAWLFAVHRRRLDPAAAKDDQLHALAPVEDGGGAAAHRSLAAFGRYGDRSGESLACAVIAELAAHRNDLEQARAWVGRALERAPGPAERAIALGVGARIAISRGDLGAARSDARGALALHRAERHRLGEALALLALADVAIGEGGFSAAADRATEALALLADDGEYPAAACAHLRLGQISLLGRRRDDAERHLRTAIAEAERDRYLQQGRAAASGLPIPRRDAEPAGRAELWLAISCAQDARLDEAYRLLGHARARLRDGSLHACELLAMTTAILGRYAGSELHLPGARCFAARAMRGVLV